MPDALPPEQLFDVFLSHHSADKPWVRQLRDELVRLGLTAWFDERELPEQDNFVDGLSAAGLRRCRFLVLVVTRASLERPWVIWEWTNFMVLNGPLGRIVPVLLEPAPLPPALAATQALHAAGQTVAEIAATIARRVGRLRELPENDLRRLLLGQMLAFDLRRDGDALRVVGPDCADRSVTSPLSDAGFAARFAAFRRLVRTPVQTDAERADLVGAATAVGQALFGVMFAVANDDRLIQARQTGARPLLSLSGDYELLALPWELLHDGQDFLVRAGDIDLIRTASIAVSERCLLTPPTGPFTLVVNVSAPASSRFDYETESYRLTRALTEHCPMTPTELGTLDDLVATVQRVGPVGVHFSGHGGPGTLLFEDDDGADALVTVRQLVDRLELELRERPPLFFYLACCHGNDLSDGAESAAALLHRAGVTQVVGYSGPIVDELSTRAEEALYAALAAGQPTRQAVREARAALLRPLGEVRGRHREGTCDGGAVGAYPFAWSQLVLYHRGPDFPLGTPTTQTQLQHAEQALRRTFEGLGRRRVLKTGFIGRRRELHRVRRHLLREGKRVLVLQGLGGLGKSTLAFHVPPLLRAARAEVCILWCEGAERERDPVEALVGQLLDYCRKRFGLDWEGVVQQVDRAAEEPLERFTLFLQTLLANVPRLVLVLDNLESLLVGPSDVSAERPDDRAFGTWRSEALAALWRLLREMAEGGDNLWLIATCRYQNDDFLDVLLPVTPLPADALFRLTGWFPALQTLATATRARLAARLDGHPRAVEYAEDLIKAHLTRRQQRNGPWRLPQPASADDLEREWRELVEPVLPTVRDRLWANLLLAAVWDNVLDERQRRMLMRMTLLRAPWEWGLMAHLGDADELAATAEESAEALCRTSLLETTEMEEVSHSTVHPATAAYVRSRQPMDEGLRLQTHERVGTYLEEQAKTSRWIDTDLEAGYHLFEARAYDRAYELLGSASSWLRNHGRVREGRDILETFLAAGVREQMQQELLGRLLGKLGLAYDALSQPQRAIDFHQQRLVIAREIGDRGGEGNALGNLGTAYAVLGQPQRAIDFYQQRLVIAREIGDRGGEGNAFGNLGIAYRNLGQPQRAIDFHEQALVISSEIGDRRAESQDLGNLGIAYAVLGQPQRAIDFFQQHLVIARETGDRRGEGSTLGNLGKAYAALGQPQRAIDFFQQHLVIARETGDRRGEANACWNLGDELAKLDRVAEAIPLMEVFVQFEQDIGHPDAAKHAAHVEQLRQRLLGPPTESP